jgi:hypothetical protein
MILALKHSLLTLMVIPGHLYLRRKSLPVAKRQELGMYLHRNCVKSFVQGSQCSDFNRASPLPEDH